VRIKWSKKVCQIPPCFQIALVCLKHSTHPKNLSRGRRALISFVCFLFCEQKFVRQRFEQIEGRAREINMEKRKKKKETNRLVVCLLFFGKFNENLKLKKIKSRISVKVDERRIKNQLIERRKKKN